MKMSMNLTFVRKEVDEEEGEMSCIARWYAMNDKVQIGEIEELWELIYLSELSDQEEEGKVYRAFFYRWKEYPSFNRYDNTPLYVHYFSDLNKAKEWIENLNNDNGKKISVARRAYGGKDSYFENDFEYA
jgi:hypothetical protein